MNQKQKNRVQKLIQALRSRKYKQGQGSLCIEKNNKFHFCCLGVACELAIQNGIKISSSRPETPEKDTTTLHTYDRHESFLPPKVQEYYGFTSDMGLYGKENVKKQSLVALNDRGVKFNKIANIIETELNNPNTLLFKTKNKK